MKTHSRTTYERLSQFRRLSMTIRWAILVLGVMVLGLHFQAIIDLEGIVLRTSSIWLLYITETGLLIIALSLFIIHGVVERRRAALEQLLGQENLKFQQLTDYVDEVFWLADKRTREVLYVSPAYERIWGHSCEELYQNPEQWFESIAPEDRARVAAERVTQYEGGYNVEYQLERRDGTRRWVHDRAFPIYNDEGEVHRLAGLATDITERKALTVTLVQQDRLLNMANRMARLGGWSMDLVEEQVTFSDEACSIFDLPPGTVLPLEEAFEFYPPESRRRVSEAVEDCIKFGRPYDVEIQLTSANGRFVWVRSQGHPVLDERGAIVKLEGAIQDITDRKHASNLLAQGLQRFRDFADAMPNLVWTADAQGRLDYGNRTLEGFLGASEQDGLLDERWRKAIDTSDKVRYEAAWTRALGKGGRFHLECLLARFDGQRRWHSIQATPVRDAHGTIVKWYGNAVNIHERKLNEEKAQDLAERLATTLESITDAFLTIDQNWCFTYVNREAERLLQRSRVKLLQHNMWEAFPEALGTPLEDYCRRAMMSGQKFAFEAFFEPLNFWAAVNVYPAREGLSVYFQDVSDRRRSEKAKERIRELENSRELAELSNKTKSQFLASMTHEIRTPINGIVGMVDVLHQTSLRGYQVEMVDIIRESSQSLLGIVDDILDFSKIEAGKLELHPTQFDPRSLLRSVCLLMDRMACNHDVELTLFADPSLPDYILGDDLRLRQILLNLVSNAIKFSANQGRRGLVRVEVVALDGCTPGEKKVKAPRGAVDVEWRVRDNGVGMTSATLSRLFNPFVQADASTTRLFGGTGLGLSITHNLVELMGGDIKVTSQPDLGTEFRMRLCLPKVVGQDQSESEKQFLKGHSILVWPSAPTVNAGTINAGTINAGTAAQNSPAQDSAVPLISVWSAYLAAAGAEVLSGLEVGSEEALRSCHLVVFDSGDGNPDEAELKARLPAAMVDDVRWLVIGRGHRRKVRPEGDKLYRIDANSLSHANFLEAVSVALQLATPEALVAKGGGGRVAGAAPSSPSREQALAEGTLVLVVEDNETNRKVIQQQLGLLGYAADLTANGCEALERWKENPHSYSAILTDLHMPQMDGYKLTEAVRQCEREQWGSRTIPIVALTANALGEEDEQCKEIGMNDYLVKPISLEGLRKALERWCPPQAKSQKLRGARSKGEGTGFEDTGFEDKDSGGVALDLSVLTDLIGSDADTVLEFIESFASSSEQLINKLRQAGHDRDWTRVADAAHSLKSSARSMGALPLGELCAELESAAQNCAEQEARAEAVCVSESMQRACAVLNAVSDEWRRVQQALKETNIKSGL